MRRRTILVVDDQNVNRKILKKLLGTEYKILEATNGEEALALLRENAERISAVVLDIVMPVLDGYGVLAAMSKDVRLSKIPVLVGSQQDGDEAEIKALSLGAQDFVAKPYKVEIVRRRLSNIIRLRETAALINKVERDELTGLYNKQFFLQNAEELLRQNPQEQYDLLCFGIEHFKLVNETYGTARGDDLLRHIAEQIREGAKQSLAARFDADTFYLLAPHQESYAPEDFFRFYQRINTFPVDMDIKMHCGIFAVGNTDVPVSVMCDRAQLASNKNKGMYDKPFFFYDNTLRQKLLEEQFITSNMRTALKERQFHVFYQPKYDLNTESIVGAEALVRWEHPERGRLSPGTFIPLFESNGFIMELDQYVWDAACRDLRSWMDRGLPTVAVSVNVSRADIFNPKLQDILLGLLEKYQIPIRYLHLEITESAYTENPEQIIPVVKKLRRLGFVIEMDDFGSGYSSLNMLAEMPVDVLKLDMHFIQNETEVSSGKGILSFVISLAKWMNLAVVAEGVETAEQIATLRSMDCFYVQGFFYAGPMPAQAFETLLQEAKTSEMICAGRPAQPVIREHAADVRHAGREILVVDDMEINRAVLVGIFQNEYDIVEKENGGEAWDYLCRNYERVELVLLDLLMPVMDGFQLLDKIRSDENMRELPVIITSQGDAQSEPRAALMQANDFISKPYNPTLIRHRVHNVIDSHHYRQMKRAQAAVAGETPKTGRSQSAAGDARL